MSVTEVLVVVGGLVLGYWIMAVFVPSLRDGDPPSGDRSGRAGDGAGGDVDRPGGAAPEVVRWFEVLDIPESSSREEITAAYKRLIRQYHPDLVAGMGRELRDLAEVRSSEINVAYDIGLKLRSTGWHA